MLIVRRYRITVDLFQALDCVGPSVQQFVIIIYIVLLPSQA